MVRCKACGFLMKEGKVHDRCPACGAPKTAFEPYKDPMSWHRRRILRLTLHPIATHFPIALVVAALVFSIGAPFFSGAGRDMLVSTVKIITLFIPAVVLVTLGAGIWDGKIRFRKIRNSHILKMKLLYAIILFFVTTGQTVTAWTLGAETGGYIAGTIILGAAGIVLVLLLGLLGTSIMEAAFPGK